MIYNIKFNNDSLILKKGTLLQRLTLNKNEVNNERHVYVSQLALDNDKYLIEWGNRGYKVILKVIHDIKIPNHKERVEAFISSVEKADVNKVAKDISVLKYRNDSDKFLREWENRSTKKISNESYISFISSLVTSDYNRSIYFTELKERGYDGTIDDNDADWVEQPIIIFERNKNIKQIEYIPIDKEMISDAKSRVAMNSK